MKKLFFLSVAFLLFAFNGNAKSIKVNNQAELQAAIKNAVAGDEIILANGVWKDVQIKFTGNGTSTAPIVLRAETVGKVTIEGVSDLKLGGTYLEVKGLYFKNGYTPSATVIDFHIDKKNIANHCKVSQCVIEDFTQLNRVRDDHWVEFWGRNNQLDHCYITGKSNQGPTIMVILKGNEHINNHHQITNNHFGPRPRKGGPHGETIQVGDSGTSMAPSFTLIANNFFERCDGEVEIISNKSNNNEYRNNIFYKSEGSLVLRHGNYCTIDGNIFIGDENSDFMGGVRVVNTGHWITNNYFYKIKGEEFRSALAVMNGVPKSPQNRYNQVTDAVIAYNTFVDCITPWQFSVGANMNKSDVLPAQEIRSARPDRIVVANNIIYNQTPNDFPIKAYDKVDGVLFKNNILNSPNNSDVKDKGIQTESITVAKMSDWLYVPTVNKTSDYKGFDFENIKKDLFGNDREAANVVGAIILPVNKKKGSIDVKDYGTNWFPIKTATEAPKTVQVTNTKELVSALDKATAGTIIELKKGVYALDASLVINKSVTIKAKDKKSKATLVYKGEAKSPVFLMEPKGNLRLENMILKGNKEQYAFATLQKNMKSAYNLWVNNVEINEFDTVLNAYKDAFADTISIDNSIVKNCKRGIRLADEDEDLGEYNAEFVYIKNSKFDAIQSSILDYYRGGYDESTIGGNLVFENNTVTNSGKEEPTGILVKTRGIVNVSIAKNSFVNNPVTLIALLWGEKGQAPKDNNIKNSGEFKIEENLKQKMMY
ncbi:chondroitinase-B domain-containing protein [Flavobacterium sp. NG2]|uniref:chondroitinase-B domain-containing protein n=1 Tax=Flavobacterium sp. NG2 TaxID=3097547 RepID=UPI002A8379AD|nr:chondroitinase-B domain-containing protein [Flavobacterium sp. NG2]WPR72084.1 chondroitinase-B domain-containing protein [Flavobacterium sp. NG2]